VHADRCSVPQAIRSLVWWLMFAVETTLGGGGGAAILQLLRGSSLGQRCQSVSNSPDPARVM
jgi:hypothetical protein